MTQDDKLTLFLGHVADNRAKLIGITASEIGFADDNRFAFNLSPRMKAFAWKIFEKYGRILGWKDIDTPPKELQA